MHERALEVLSACLFFCKAAFGQLVATAVVTPSGWLTSRNGHLQLCATEVAPAAAPASPIPPHPAARPPLQLLCQSFQMAGEQDRRILKAAATSKRGKQGGAGTAATAAKDAKTFQAGVGGQADAASLLLEGLLLKVRSLVGSFDTCRWNAFGCCRFWA